MPKNERYVYTRLHVSLASASRLFVRWVQANVQKLTGLHGAIEVQHRKERHPVWLLRYAKRESVELLRWMYDGPDLPALARKRAKAEPVMLKMR